MNKVVYNGWLEYGRTSSEAKKEFRRRPYGLPQNIQEEAKG